MFNFILASSLIGGIGAFLFGSWLPLMGVLLVMIALDILTGFGKAIYNKELRSRNMSHGMLRKGGIMVMVIVANMIDVAMFAGLPVARVGVLSYYIGMEGISILENLTACNVPIPAFIKKYLLVLKDKGKDLEEKETR
ncbi:phage holin family protein [Peribacillus frigoritolerans]|nr:phage holin family protein [Peribacillus frigoritolerans]